MMRGHSVVESEISTSTLLGGLEPDPLHLRTLELVYYRECASWCFVATGAGGSWYSRCMVWNSYGVSGELCKH